MKRHTARARAIVLGTLVLLMFGVVPAAAYWSSTGANADTVATGTLDPPTGVTVPANSSSTLTVSWTPPLTLPAPSGYYVERVGSTTVPACGTSRVAPAVATSCVDSAIADGTYSYVVTSVYRSWTVASAPSDSVLVATPVALAITTQPTTTIAGEDISPPVAVALRTAGGTAAGQPGVPITLSFGANPAGGVLAGTLTELTNVAGVASFPDVSINKAGAGYSLAAASPGLTAATSSTFSVSAAPAYKFVFITGPVTGIATSTASRGPLTIQSQDVFDNPTYAPVGGTAVSLSSSSTGTKIFAATSGGTSITTITIPAGASSVSFYYGDSLAGTPQISASRTSFSTGRQTQTITAAAPSKFAFTSAPVTGSASLVPTLGPLTVQLTDTFGNTAVATVTTTATMASSSTGNKRFSLSATGTPTTTSLIFAVGVSASSFYYSDSKAGTPTITVSRSGYTSATQVQTILSTTATKLAITSTAITLAAPSTTASRGPFTVQLQDATSNPVLATTGGRTVTLSSSSTSTTKVFSATLSGTPTTTVTIPAGAHPARPSTTATPRPDQPPSPSARPGGRPEPRPRRPRPVLSHNWPSPRRRSPEPSPPPPPGGRSPCRAVTSTATPPSRRRVASLSLCRRPPPAQRCSPPPPPVPPSPRSPSPLPLPACPSTTATPRPASLPSPPAQRG